MRAGGWRNRALLRVWPYLRPYRRHVIGIVVSAILSMAAQVSLPLIIAAVIDGPLARGDRGGILRWCLLAVGLAVIDVGLTYARRIWLAIVATEMETHLRNDLYEHLQALDVDFHDQWQSGQLLSRSTTDLAIVRRFVGFGAVFFVLISVLVTAIFTVLLFLSWPLALLTFGAAIPVVVLCRRFEREYYEVVRQIQDRTGDLTTTIEEAAKGIRVLKAFGRSREAFEGFDRQCVQIYDDQLGRVRLHTRFVWVLAVIPNLTLTAVLLAGVLAVGNGSLALGELVAFVAYVLMLTFPLEILAWIMALAGEAETAASRVFEVFDTEPAIKDRDGAIHLKRAVGDVCFEDVSFRYPNSGRAALEHVDLVVHAGETIAIVGATGSGKTTLATLLTRLYDPTAGRVTLDGADLRDLSLRTLRANVAFAFEEPSLFSASVRENLLMGKPDATDPELDAALEIAQAGFALELPWGLETRIGEQGLTLSGGQRQRLALARAIIGRSRVLVLDDPLSSVDVHTEAQVSVALRPVLEDSTVFIVVHRPSTIALADRAVLLDHGRLVATGTHQHLMAHEPRYRAVLSEETAA
ncbi:MAG: ABC transporter ATP-binding protein [Acidimicrobiia bacterium]